MDSTGGTVFPLGFGECWSVSGQLPGGLLGGAYRGVVG